MTLLVLLLVGFTVTGLVAIAIALVLATDRLRATVERLLGARSTLEPRVEALQEDLDRARAHAERLRAAPLRTRRDGTRAESD